MPHYWTVLPVFTKVAAKKCNLSASEISRVGLVPVDSFSCLPKTDRLKKDFAPNSS